MSEIQITYADGSIRSTDRAPIELVNAMARADDYSHVMARRRRHQLEAAREAIRWTRVAWFGLGYFAACIVGRLVG